MSALWIHLITPIPISLAQPLVEGLLNQVVCLDSRIQTIIPQDLLDSRETIRRALEKTQLELVEAAGPMPENCIRRNGLISAMPRMPVGRSWNAATASA